jgi:hypothetical protein
MAKLSSTYKPRTSSPLSASQTIIVSNGSRSLEEAKQRFKNALAQIEQEFYPKEHPHSPPAHQNTLPPTSSISLEEAKERFENALARIEAELPPPGAYKGKD